MKRVLILDKRFHCVTFRKITDFLETSFKIITFYRCKDCHTDRYILVTQGKNTCPLILVSLPMQEKDITTSLTHAWRDKERLHRGILLYFLLGLVYVITFLKCIGYHRYGLKLLDRFGQDNKSHVLKDVESKYWASIFFGKTSCGHFVARQ